MAALNNDLDVLRFSLVLARRHEQHWYGSAAVEALDRRDGEFWPLVRLPVLKLLPSDAPALHQALREVCAGVRPGVSARLGESNELAFSVGPQPGGGYLVEVGFDLAAVVRELAGVSGEPGRELSLFRFSSSTEAVVRFADGLTAEAG